MALLDDRSQRIRFLLFLVAQDGFVNWSLAENAQPFIDFVTAVDQVSQVLRIGLCGRFVQILHDVPRELVLADLERVLSEGGGTRLRAQPDQMARGGRRTKVASHMQRRMIVGILLIEDLFQKEFGLRFEIADHLVVVCGRDQLLKLVQDVNASPRVVGILRVLEVLDLHEEVEELVEALNDVDIDLEERLERLVALGVLVHRGIVDRVPSHHSILLRQNLTVPLDNVACV